MTEGDDVRKILVSVEAMDLIANKAFGNGTVVKWGEPDQDGFYTPTITTVQ